MFRVLGVYNFGPLIERVLAGMINKVSYKPILRVCKAVSVAGALTFREQEKKVGEGK